MSLSRARGISPRPYIPSTSRSIPLIFVTELVTYFATRLTSLHSSIYRPANIRRRYTCDGATVFPLLFFRWALVLPSAACSKQPQSTSMFFS
jgi:hypothetical protein